MTTSSIADNLQTTVRGAGEGKTTSTSRTDNDPKEKLATEGSNSQKPPPMQHSAMLIDKLVKESYDWITWRVTTSTACTIDAEQLPEHTITITMTMALLEDHESQRYARHPSPHGLLKSPSTRQHATKVTNLKVAIHPDYPEQEVSIGGSLSDTGRAAVCALLQRNLDIFAWEPKHMTGVPRSITEHKLKIRQGYSPVRQKKRGQAPERAKAILEEHCPTINAYPLPEIDWKVESLCGYPFKCFLDAYKGYHQIQMDKDDEEKTTAFHPSPKFLPVSRQVPHPLVLNTQEVYEEGDFPWTTEAEEAFTQLKQHIAALPTLVAPRPGEELIMYL
ncbi:hypothetical protein Tco_1427338 [Tanacetum coccineum]